MQKYCSRLITVISLVAIILISVNMQFVNSTQAGIFLEITKIGSIDTNGETINVFVKEGTAFVLDSNDYNPGGLVIIDISDPTNPVKLSSFYDGGNPLELVVKNDLVYLADGSDGIEVINISDLTNPVEIYQYPVSNYCSDVELVDDPESPHTVTLTSTDAFPGSIPAIPGRWLSPQDHPDKPAIDPVDHKIVRLQRTACVDKPHHPSF